MWLLMLIFTWNQTWIKNAFELNLSVGNGFGRWRWSTYVHRMDIGYAVQVFTVQLGGTCRTCVWLWRCNECDDKIFFMTCLPNPVGRIRSITWTVPVHIIIFFFFVIFYFLQFCCGEHTTCASTTFPDNLITSGNSDEQHHYVTRRTSKHTHICTMYIRYVNHTEPLNHQIAA